MEDEQSAHVAVASTEGKLHCTEVGQFGGGVIYFAGPTMVASGEYANLTNSYRKGIRLNEANSTHISAPLIHL